MIAIQTQTVLVPKQVYVGDRAELRCTFSSDYEGFRQAVKDGPVNLSLSDFKSSPDFSEYEIKEVTLVPSGINYYNLVVSFVPWRTGNIQFPDYDLGNAVLPAINQNPEAGEISVSNVVLNENNLIVHFDPFLIVSVTETQGITTLNDYSAPLLLPGTVYKLYSVIIALIIVLVVIIRLIVMHKKVAAFIKSLILKRKYNKNKKQCFRRLNYVRKSDISAHDCSEMMQKIVRNYLDFRFKYPFTKTVTSEIQEKLENQCQLQLNEINGQIVTLEEKFHKAKKKLEELEKLEKSEEVLDENEQKENILQENSLKENAELIFENSVNSHENNKLQEQKLLLNKRVLEESAILEKFKNNLLLLKEEKLKASLQMRQFFERTDFLRYSANSQFNENEKNEIIDSIMATIELLEKEKIAGGGGNA